MANSSLGVAFLEDTPRPEDVIEEPGELAGSLFSEKLEIESLLLIEREVY